MEKRKKIWKETEVWKKWGSGWGREKERKRQEGRSGWERPGVAMETGSYQLTPCFSTRSPPTSHHPTPFPSPPSPFLFPSPHPYFSSPSSLYFLLSLRHYHTPFTFLTHTSPPPLSLPLYINHTLVSSLLALSSISGFISTRSLSSSPLSSDLNHTSLKTNPQKRRWKRKASPDRWSSAMRGNEERNFLIGGRRDEEDV